MRHEKTGGWGLQKLKKSLTQPSIWLIDRLANLWPFYPVVSDQRDQRGGVGEGEEGDKENRSTSGRSRWHHIGWRTFSLVNQSCKVLYRFTRLLYHCIFMRLDKYVCTGCLDSKEQVITYVYFEFWQRQQRDRMNSVILSIEVNQSDFTSAFYDVLKKKFIVLWASSRIRWPEWWRWIKFKLMTYY